jgi:UDP-glucose 4-epimerase
VAYNRSERPWTKNRELFLLLIFALKALFRMMSRSEAAESVTGSLEIDTSKALKTGWHPEISLDRGLPSALQAPRLPT